METQILKVNINTLKYLPFLELKVKGPFCELLHTFLQVLQRENLAQKYTLQAKQQNFKMACYMCSK